jgi:hypothetical protein
VRELVRALRHADTSLVIDLSQVAHDRKVEYVRSVLPALATLRRETGLPHRIVVDEAHYFLHGPDVPDLLDLRLNGYTLVTYRASKVHHDLLAAAQAVIVTRESDPAEVHALFDACSSCRGSGSEQQWAQLLGTLVLGEAVLLPITEEAAGQVRRLHLAPRLTPHVRHMAKYIDIPVAENRAFVFGNDGPAPPRRARTMRQFVEAVESSPGASLDGHMRRRDFSRWISDVFGDFPLAATIRRIERAAVTGAEPDAADAIANAVRCRYEFVEGDRPHAA